MLNQRGQPRSIWSVAKDLLADAYGIRFVEMAEGVAWAEHVKDVRNRLVHGEQEGASRAEAEAALQAVADARKVILAAADGG